jgi:hypothetical protein
MFWLLAVLGQLPNATTKVILQDFLAKNLQINIIRNSFDALGVLTEKVFGNEVTQRTTEF